KPIPKGVSPYMTIGKPQEIKDSGSKVDDGSEAGSEVGSDDGSAITEDFSDRISEASGVSEMSDLDKEEQINNLNESGANNVKKSMLIQINRFKTKYGYDVGSFDTESDVKELQFELDRLEYEKAFRIKIRFYRICLWLITWLIERGAKYVGYGTGLKGWSD